MAQTFNNNNEMENYFNKVIEEVIEAVSNDLLNDFLKHIDETIYAAKPGEYERYYKDGGFYSGWKISDEQDKQIGDYVKALVFDGSRLIAPQNDMRNSQMSHGGHDGSDVRNLMAMILNNAYDNLMYSYNGGALYLAELSSQGYWDSYVIDLDKKIVKWFDKELGKYGIKRG
jgi:hypothetical protein